VLSLERCGDSVERHGAVGRSGDFQPRLGNTDGEMTDSQAQIQRRIPISVTKAEVPEAPPAEPEVPPEEPEPETPEPPVREPEEEPVPTS
jgi:hypothetical protein